MPSGSHSISRFKEDTMRTFNWDTYSPFQLGFDETFNRLERLAEAGQNYPPYNVFHGGDGRTVLEIALAGFSREDIEVTTEQNILTVKASTEEKDERSYTHKGIATRSFDRSWQLGDSIEVKDVDYKDGLLVVNLTKVLPENQQKKFWFGTGAAREKLEAQVS